MQVYKIRHKITGLYSKGGSYPTNWGKLGKFWRRKCDLSNHLNIATRYNPSRYADAEIVILEVKEEPIQVESIQAYLEARNERKRKRQELREKRRQQYVREQELRQLEALKTKYGQ